MLSRLKGSGSIANDSLRLYTLVLGAIALAVAGYALLRRKSKTADDVERERRAWLSTVGRITTAR